MSDEDLWHLVGIFSRLPDDKRVDIRIPPPGFSTCMLFSVSEFRALVQEAWTARGRQPNPEWGTL